MKTIFWRVLILSILTMQPIFGDELDSLRTVLKKTNYNDTNRVNLLLNIGEYEGIMRIGYWDSLRKECEQKLNSAPVNLKDFYSKRLGTITNDLGFVADELGEINIAMEAFQKGLELFLKNGDKKGISKAYNNLGSQCEDNGDFKQALDYYYKSLKLREEIKDTAGITIGMNNIGMVYYKQKNYAKAREFYSRSLEFAKKANNIKIYSVALGNIGLTYSRAKDYDKALTYYQEAYHIQDSLRDPFHQSLTLNNLAGIYKIQHRYGEALKAYEKSLRLIDSIGYNRAKPVITSNIAELHLLMGNTAKAKPLAEKGLTLAKETGFIGDIGANALVLSSVDEKMGNYKEALINYKLYKKMMDSLDNDDAKREAVQKDLQYKYDKKVVADSLNMVIERHSNELRVKEEKTKRFVLYGGLAVVIVFAFFVFNRLQITRKQNKVISEQKAEVEEKNSVIIKQKELVEEKQKEIVDSINYAKRIQQAVLTGNEVWQSIADDHFILFQPKDIVSGDFYWATNASANLSIFALADCTGHGVPGGFMSMLGNSFLNEIVVEKKIYEPGEILNQLRSKIIKALAQEGQSNQKDGMDICLCAFDKKKGTLEFAGANNPLWVMSSNEITEYKGNKMPIGVYVNDQTPFSSQKIQVQKGDCLYLITDGFADQFGGEKGKKFKYKPLMELLQKHQNEAMVKQKEILANTINSWKKGYEQVDDISLIGIRV